MQHEEESSVYVLAKSANQRVSREEEKEEETLMADSEMKQREDREERHREEGLMSVRLHEIGVRQEEDRVKEVRSKERDERLRGEFMAQSQLISEENERQLAAMTAAHRREIEEIQKSSERHLAESLKNENILYSKELRNITMVIEDLKSSKKGQIMDIECAQLKHNLAIESETRLHNEEVKKISAILDKLSCERNIHRDEKSNMKRIVNEATYSKNVEVERMERAYSQALYDLQSSHDLLEQALQSRTVDAENMAESNKEICKLHSDTMKEMESVLRENEKLRSEVQNVTVDINNLERERRQQIENINAVKKNYFEDIETLKYQASEDLREFKMLSATAQSDEIKASQKKIEIIEEEKNNLLNLLIMAEDRERTYNMQLENAKVSLQQAQSMAGVQMLLASSGHEEALRVKSDEYESRLSALSDDCVSQLRTQSASHVIEFAVITESFNKAMEMLRASSEEQLEKAHASSGQQIAQLESVRRAEIQSLLITHSEEKADLVSQGDAAAQAVRTRHMEEMCTAANTHREEMTIMQLEKEKAVRVGERKAVQILELTDSIGQLKVHLAGQKEEDVMEGGAQSDRVVRRLKAKLDAVAIEFAHAEGRCFQLLASSVKEREEMSAIRQELSGSRRNEVVTRQETADAAVRLEHQIHSLQIECDALRMSAPNISERKPVERTMETDVEKERGRTGTVYDATSLPGSDITDNGLLVLLGVKEAGIIRSPAEKFEDVQGGFLSSLLRQVGSVMDEMQEKERQRICSKGASHTGMSAPQIKGIYGI